MYARRVLGDRSDTAEDVVQEAYLRLLGLAASDEAPTAARPWLFRVVRNLAIDERRSVARRADPVADTAILGRAAMDDTAGLVEQREELVGTFRDIAALPPRERRALEMDQAGIGAQAIATELGTTPNAVHQALFRARKRLRNSRAVAWGLIPVGLAPFALRLSDPALAVTITNLPPGAPIGRALPVAGIVAAVMVGGSTVAPTVDRTPSAQAIQFVHTAPAGEDSDDNVAPVRPVSATKGSTKSGPSKNSGTDTRSSGDDDSADDDNGTNRSRNRGPGSIRGGGDDEPGRDSGSGSSATGGDDDGTSTRRGKGSGSGKAATPSADEVPNVDGSPDVPDAPDAPDAPDDPSGTNSGNGKG